MSGEIAKAIETGVKDVAEHAGQRFGTLARGFYEDTRKRMVRTAEQTEKTEAENKKAFEDARNGGEQKASRDVADAAAGVRPGEGGAPKAGGAGGTGGGRPDAEPPRLGGGERGGGQPADGNGGCDGRGGDPVDVVSGQMITEKTDVELPGLLPLVLRRAYASAYQGGRSHGPGWSSTLDQRLEIDEDSVHYAGDDAQILHYPRPNRPGQQAMPADGARWPLTWDDSTDTYRIEDPATGWVRHFGPNRANLALRPITALTDRNDNRISYLRGYDGSPVGVNHSAGYRIGIDTADTDGGFRIQAIRLLDGARNADSADSAENGTTLVEYRYDERGRLTGIVDSTGLPYGYEYDESNRITAWVDRNNYRYQYTYGPDGRVVRGQGKDGYLSASFDYDLDNRVTTVTNSLGHATVYHYDAHNHLTRVVDPLGNVELTEFDRHHRPLSRTDPLGNTTRFTLSADGDPARIDRPDGTAVTLAHNDLRLPVEVVGPDGARWEYAYDERGNVLRVTNPTGAATSYAYADNGELRSVTDALGHVTTVTTNRAGLPLSITEANGATWTYVRDARGRITAVTDPLGALTSTEWTGADTPARRTHPDGASEAWRWDANGDLLAHTDRGGFTTSFEMGPFHRITARTDPDGTRHAFAHDTELRLITVTDPQDLVWQYTYDQTGNLIGERDFNGRTVGYQQDAAGRLVRLTNGAGETIAITRDALGRMTRQHTGDSAVDTAGTSFDYDPAGLLVRAVGPDAEVVFTRDRLGRIVSETVNGRTLTSAFDPLGRRISRTTPTGQVSTWQYDELSRPHTLVTGGQRLTFGHDAVGRETFRWLGAASAVTNSWDSAGRLTARQLVQVDGSEGDRTSRLLHERTWSYRTDGVPTAVGDSVTGAQRFELDRLGRVTSVQAATWTERYAYDATGNLRDATDTGSPESDVDGPRSLTGTLLRQAGRTHFDYDAQGRLIRTVRRTLSGGQRIWTYRYDAYDRLVEAVNPAGQRWRYRYDPLGRRISKQRLGDGDVPAEEVRFTWDGEILAEQDHVRAGADVVTATTWDHEPGTWTPITQDRRTFYAAAPQRVIDRRFHAIITDLVGTPTELVTPDGRVEWRQRAGLWGNAHNSPGADTIDGIDCLLRFPGQYHDAETDLDYNYHRYYDPETGRYTSPDPLGLVPAPNHHGYVANPLVWLDPLGLITTARYQHLDRTGFSNYTLSDANGNTYYSGMFGPGSTAADVARRHSANANRFDPANGDAMNVVPGTRTYGESRLMEQRTAEQNNTIIGRDGNNYRGNRQNPLAGDKLSEYQDYETRKAGAGCP